MKIDVGTGMVLVLGLPNLLSTVWFGWLWGTENCIRILPYGAQSPPICNGGLLAIAIFTFVLFSLICTLAWYWRD